MIFTIKDINYITSLSRFAITKQIKKIYPEKVVKGKKTKLTREEFLIVLNTLRVKNFVEAYNRLNKVLK